MTSKDIDFNYKHFENLRKRLLDLTNRNKLLNFKLESSYSLRLIDELPNKICEQLLNERIFYFKPIPAPKKEELIEKGYIKINDKKESEELKPYPDAKTWAKELGLDINYELPKNESEETLKFNHKDSELQTDLYIDELDAKLRKILKERNSRLQESGIETLYLTLGFLEWYEGKNSNKPIFSPLFTIPVSIDREIRNCESRYKIKIREDDTVENFTLKEKLLSDFNIKLPDFDIDNTTPEEYFSLCEESIKNYHDFKIRRFSSLANLDFTNQVLYKDLSISNWKDFKNLENHPNISIFFKDKKETEESEFTPEDVYKIDEIKDDKVTLIADADSSQHSAIIDALEEQEKNSDAPSGLVIQGPPGTGKSQTISNLIASCLSLKKKVLFVAEKKAALDVVKTRLDKANIGDLCLELHSNKANKVNLLKDLSNSINKLKLKKEGTDKYYRLKEDINNKKGELNNYSQKISTPWKDTGFSPFEIFSSASFYKQKLDKDFSNFEIKNIDENVTEQTYTKLCEKIDLLKNLTKEIENQSNGNDIKNHMWYGVIDSNLNQESINNIYKLISNWQESLNDLEKTISSSNVSYMLNKKDDLSYLISFSNLKKYIVESGFKGKNYKFLSFLATNENCETFFNEYLNILEIREKIEGLNILKDAPKTINNKNDIVALDNFIKYLKNDLKINVDDKDTQEKISLNDISQISSLLSDMKKRQENISSCVKNICDKLDINYKNYFDSTLNKIDEIKKFFSFFSLLSNDLYQKRNKIFEDDVIDDFLSKAKTILIDASFFYNNLRTRFNLDNLLTIETLKSNYEILYQSGLFSAFSQKVRNAKKEIKDLSLNKKVGNVEEDYKNLSSLKENLDKLYSINPAFNEFLSGINTPIDDLLTLRNWYKDIQNSYNTFSNCVELKNALFSMDNNLFKDILSYYETSIKEDIDFLFNAKEKLNIFFKNLSLFSNENEASDKLNEIYIDLSSYIEKLKETLIFDNKNIKDLIDASNLLKDFNKKKSTWENKEIVKEVRKNFFDLSFDDSKKDEIALANETLNLFAWIKNNDIPLDHFKTITAGQYDEIINFIKDIDLKIKNISEKQEDFTNNNSINIKEWGDANNLSKLIQKNDNILSNNDSRLYLASWQEYLKLRQKTLQNELEDFVKIVNDNLYPISKLDDLFNYLYFTKLANIILNNDPYFKDFSSIKIKAIESQFKQEDREMISLAHGKIKEDVYPKYLPKGNGYGKISTFTEVSLIQHLATLKRMNVSIRSLLQRASNTIIALKPCFMMSPMAVAQYLRPEDYEFDYIIMDEASQITPEKALGSIARAKKVIVVGDSKQLPPTSFFEKESQDDDSEWKNIDSILDVAVTPFKSRTLNWHYRSRHESLIAFSNQFFYDGKLVLFPSPITNNKELGITYKKVDGIFNARKNKVEAKLVAEYVANILKENPLTSIGIVAMNIEQMDEIEDQIESILKQDADFGDAYNKNKEAEEPLFIKNLESVQGDERDIIVISITYGKDSETQKVMQRFGPINSQTGWRRLNVLFTRSKKQMIVFSSMNSFDIQTNKKDGGVAALKNFLEYCETGNIVSVSNTSEIESTLLQKSIKLALEEKGYKCKTNVGVAGYFIDVAVYDSNSEKFILAIECDGKTYTDAKSTRDRVRLREQVLENLGWKFIRIFSVDWFKNKDAEILSILNKIKEA